MVPLKDNPTQTANSSSRLPHCFNFQCFHNIIATSKSPEKGGDQHRKPGGWKTMPYILGNETFERLASLGIVANFMVFLLTQFHMEQVAASNVINIWSGLTNFSPLLGAYISDAYWGRFKTIAFAIFASFLGMLTMTLIAWIPGLHPPHCNVQLHEQCKGPTASQFGFLALALGFLSVGSAGIRPCNIPFGVDQFDARTEEGRKGINSFFNWYYATFTLVLIIAFTLVVYIQNSVSWVWGFGIPTMMMLCCILVFFLGMKTYIYVTPEGSVFSGIGQVLVASYRKRKLELPHDTHIAYYDPPPKETLVTKLPSTHQFRFLNKAAIITEDDFLADGSRVNPWRLCSIQTIEETKCLLRVIPIWVSGIVCFTAMAQQGTFTISQATKMNRRIGRDFKVPPGTLFTISMVTVGLWIPIYDRIVVPNLRKVTKLEGGISLLQRMGIGLVFSILSMIVAGLVERMRRASALMHGAPNGIAPMTVFWLAPQLILMGFAEAFNFIGQIEFYNKEFPENMSSVANSLFSCTMAGASYLSAVLVNLVHKTTGHPDWLTKDINAGRVEYLYFLIAGLGVLNFAYFLWVASGFKYKSKSRIDVHHSNSASDLELNHITK